MKVTLSTHNILKEGSVPQLGGELRCFSMYLLKNRKLLNTSPFIVMLNSLPNSQCPLGAKLEKSNPRIKRPPISNLMHSFSIKLQKIWPISCHPGIIRKWRDILQFLASWGYTKISPNDASMVFVKNGCHGHHHNSKEFISYSSLTHLTTQTSLHNTSE